VISVCEFYAGNARNVIPQVVELKGTVRTLKPHIRQLVEKRVHEVAAGIALSTGTKIDVTYERGYRLRSTTLRRPGLRPGWRSKSPATPTS